MKKLASGYASNPRKKNIFPQQSQVLEAFATATQSTNTQQQKNAWQALKKWVQKRLYPWLTQYSPIADELAQEGLITLWLTLKNNPLQADQNPAALLAYYWQMVSALEQKARTLSQKEIRHWKKQAHFNTQHNESSAQAWEEQVYFNSQQLQSNQALKALDAEVGDIAQCITHLFNQLKKRASLGEKAIWFLKKRFHLEAMPSPAPHTEDPSYQKTIAQELGISQQGVSNYEKRLLKQCQHWLMPYYPF